MICGMDTEYVSVCTNYIKKWIAEYDAQKWEITDEIIEYLIKNGGDGIRDLEASFKKIIETAIEYKIEKIDKKFIDIVLL